MVLLQVPGRPGLEAMRSMPLPRARRRDGGVRAIRGVDHGAIPAAKTEELIAFYKRLGFAVIDEDRWRGGQVPMFAIGFWDNKINAHAPALWSRRDFTLRAPAAEPGCGDLCFVWDGNVAGLRVVFHGAGALIEVGAVRREGGRGGGKALGTSI